MSEELCSSQEEENEALPLEDVKIVYWRLEYAVLYA